MAGDLEDFLRRAAERRKQKAQQGGGPPRRQPPPQEYTDSRTERTPRQVPEDVVMAEVVEATDHTYEARKQQVAQAKRLAKRARAEAAQKQRKVDNAKQATRDAKRAEKVESQAAAKRKADVANANNPAQQLIELLRQPGGMQQAILIREILDRPEHRW